MNTFQVVPQDVFILLPTSPGKRHKPVAISQTARCPKLLDHGPNFDDLRVLLKSGHGLPHLPEQKVRDQQILATSKNEPKDT